MNQKNKLKFIEAAKPIALAVNRRCKHVSLIIHKNKIVSIGTNRRKTHPVAVEHGYLFDERHSELDAYINLPYPLRNESLILFNLRFNNQETLRMAKPCNKCLPWCQSLFKEIYYSDRTGQILELEV